MARGAILVLRNRGGNVPLEESSMTRATNRRAAGVGSYLLGSGMCGANGCNVLCNYCTFAVRITLCAMLRYTALRCMTRTRNWTPFLQELGIVEMPCVVASVLARHRPVTMPGLAPPRPPCRPSAADRGLLLVFISECDGGAAACGPSASTLHVASSNSRHVRSNAGAASWNPAFPLIVTPV